jgi:hypothetical protein
LRASLANARKKICVHSRGICEICIKKSDVNFSERYTRSMQTVHTASPRVQLKDLPKPFLFLTAAYFLASLGHFTHNAEFLCEYPNLPEWLKRAKVYLSWVAITSVGAIGFLFVRGGYVRLGLTLVAIYAALGFDGLGYYAVAPFAWHSVGANFTIVSEVIAAAFLLFGTAWTLVAGHRLR